MGKVKNIYILLTGSDNLLRNYESGFSPNFWHVIRENQGFVVSELGFLIRRAIYFDMIFKWHKNLFKLLERLIFIKILSKHSWFSWFCFLDTLMLLRMMFLLLINITMYQLWHRLITSISQNILKLVPF